MHRFAAVAVFDVEGRLLLQERGSDALHDPGRWGYPGGDLEGEENFLEAAVRELTEETGLEVDPARLESLGVRRFRSASCGDDDQFELFAVRLAITDEDVVCGEGRQIVFRGPASLAEVDVHQALAMTLERALEWSVAQDQHRFAGVILVDRRGRILLQERDEHPRIDPEKWGLAGGHLDPDEDFEAAAYRELEEETGVRLAPEGLELFAEFVVDHRQPYGTWNRMQVFVAATGLTDAEIDCREGRQIVFVDPEVARGLDLTTAATDIIPAFLDSPTYVRLRQRTEELS